TSRRRSSTPHTWTRLAACSPILDKRGTLVAAEELVLQPFVNASAHPWLLDQQTEHFNHLEPHARNVKGSDRSVVLQIGDPFVDRCFQLGRQSSGELIAKVA